MSTSAELWKLEPHVCRVCFSRIVSRRDGDARLYQCTNCGIQAHGDRAEAVCACGTKLRMGKKGGFKDAGIRCHENRAKSPEFPSLYTASYGGVQVEP